MTDLSVRQFLTFPEAQDAWVPYLNHLRVRLRKEWREVEGTERRIIEWTDFALANTLRVNLTELRNFDRTLKRLCRSSDYDFIIVREFINEDIKRALIRYGYRRAPDGSLAWEHVRDRPLRGQEQCPVCATPFGSRASCPHVRWNRRAGVWLLKRQRRRARETAGFTARRPG